MPKRVILLITIVVGLIVGAWFVMKTPGLHPVVVSPYEPAIIRAQDTVINIGKVETDSEVQATFYLYNVGGDYLRIDNIETTCGCTVAEIENKVIAPGDYAEVIATLDTSLKLGKVAKKITVHSNDPKTPEYELFLKGDVEFKMVGHERIEVKDPLVLFKGKCATCHVDRGVGKVGKDLFVADCAMCHGFTGEGRKDIAPSLLTGMPDDDTHFESIRKIIAEGTPHSPEMPPYSTAKGGPLNDDEIESLVNYLRYETQRKQEKTSQ